MCKEVNEVRNKITIRFHCHIKKINENKVVKKVFESKLTDVRGVSRPCKS